jgi:hypothetical protein
MAYTVIHEFADVTDNGHVYTSGDAYPRDGLTPTCERIAELLSNSNRIGEPLISKSDGSGEKRAKRKANSETSKKSEKSK